MAWRDENGIVPGPPVVPTRVVNDPRRVNGKLVVKEFLARSTGNEPPEELAKLNSLCLVQMDIFVVEQLEQAPPVSGHVGEVGKVLSAKCTREQAGQRMGVYGCDG